MTWVLIAAIVLVVAVLATMLNRAGASRWATGPLVAVFVFVLVYLVMEGM